MSDIKFFLRDDQIQEMAKTIGRIIANRFALNTKEVFNSEEACIYTGLSSSALYKLTMQGKIPHYKPTGKLNYFNRKELDEWLMSNRCATDEEFEEKAQRYCYTHPTPTPKDEKADKTNKPYWITDEAIPLNVLVLLTEDFQTAELKVLTDKSQRRIYKGWFPIPLLKK